MTLSNDFQLENTKRLLAEITGRYERVNQDAEEDARLRRLTSRSLKKLMNQLTEEIVRYECRRSVGGRA